MILVLYTPISAVIGVLDLISKLPAIPTASLKGLIVLIGEILGFVLLYVFLGFFLYSYNGKQLLQNRVESYKPKTQMEVQQNRSSYDSQPIKQENKKSFSIKRIESSSPISFLSLIVGVLVFIAGFVLESNFFPFASSVIGIVGTLFFAAAAGLIAGLLVELIFYS